MARNITGYKISVVMAQIRNKAQVGRDPATPGEWVVSRLAGDTLPAWFGGGFASQAEAMTAACNNLEEEASE